MYGVAAPKTLIWSSAGRPGLNESSEFPFAAFLSVYDWDTLVLLPNSGFSLPVRLVLCTGILPCAFSVKGMGQESISRVGDGSIVCLDSNGCEFLSLDSVNFLCSGNMSQHSLLEFGGFTQLNTTNSSFEGCSSASDGAVIQFYGGSVGNLNNCSFGRCASAGQGGVVSVVSASISISASSFSDSNASGGGGCVRVSGSGAIAQISTSKFVRCSAQDDGGGIRVYGGASAFIHQCKLQFSSSTGSGGAISAVGSNILLSGSVVSDCFALNEGGGVYAGGLYCYGEHYYAKNSIQVLGSTFFRCRAETSGGGAMFSTDLIIGQVHNSSFELCTSSLGGAIATNEAFMNLSSSAFRNCTAGAGGGALYGSNAAISTHESDYEECSSEKGGGAVFVVNTTFIDFASLYKDNVAVGGGGAVLWHGSVAPNTTIGCARESPDSRADGLCCVGNQAGYGQCVASTYKYLAVDGIPRPEAAVYPGLPFTVTIWKKDFYNQTVLSDSTSVLQAMMSKYASAGSALSVTGVAIGSFQKGMALLSITLRPIVSSIDMARKVVVFSSSTYIYFAGLDADDRTSQSRMQSAMFLINFANGSGICPGGYVLQLDQTGAASCTYCQPGTYSLDPLTGKLPGALPACLNCPLGSVCNGGSSVHLSLGRWESVDSRYVLVDCPNGTALVGSGIAEVQQCIPCGDNQYILNPKTTPCVNCPVGGICKGGIFDAAVSGSVWQKNGSFMRVIECPPGYILVRSKRLSLVVLCCIIDC